MHHYHWRNGRTNCNCNSDICNAKADYVLCTQSNHPTLLRDKLKIGLSKQSSTIWSVNFKGDERVEKDINVYRKARQVWCVPKFRAISFCQCTILWYRAVKISDRCSKQKWFRGFADLLDCRRGAGQLSSLTSVPLPYSPWRMAATKGFIAIETGWGLLRPVNWPSLRWEKERIPSHSTIRRR